MIVQGPTPANLAASLPAAQITISTVSVDLVGHTVTLSYGQRIVTAPLSLALQTVFENFIKGLLESDQGWSSGSSAVVSQ
ncbi:MAG TPA: hypothetical protein VE987_08185 [Polyangiaceae bacterium]|nr:hypothetical protein [Polyangiaceae bacterium]